MKQNKYFVLIGVTIFVCATSSMAAVVKAPLRHLGYTTLSRDKDNLHNTKTPLSAHQLEAAKAEIEVRKESATAAGELIKEISAEPGRFNSRSEDVEFELVQIINERTAAGGVIGIVPLMISLNSSLKPALDLLINPANRFAFLPTRPQAAESTLTESAVLARIFESIRENNKLGKITTYDSLASALQMNLVVREIKNPRLIFEVLRNLQAYNDAN